MERLQGGNERWEFLLDRCPDDLEINLIVGVDQDVPHRDDLPPRDRTVPLPRCRGQPARRLAKDQQLMKNRRLLFDIAEKGIVIKAARELKDPAGGDEDIGERRVIPRRRTTARY